MGAGRRPRCWPRPSPSRNGNGPRRWRSTKAEQDELLARARREIAAERDRAIGELRSEAVDLSLAAASKLVGERLDSEADRKLVTSYLASLGEKH